MKNFEIEYLSVCDDKVVAHLTFDTQIALTLSMCRIQEFYESPFLNFRNNIFTVDDLILGYAGLSYNYFTYWDGFNIPRSVFDRFFSTYVNMRPLEQDIYDVINLTLKGKKCDYIIATHKNSEASTLPHEMAHASFYLDKKYRAKALTYIRTTITSEQYQQLCDSLQENNLYSNVYIFDEIQAYLLTSDIIELKEMFPLFTGDIALLAYDFNLYMLTSSQPQQSLHQ